MTDRNKLTRDGDPLVDRGTIDPTEDWDEDADPPVDETDDGPQPVITGKDDDEQRNTNDETDPTIAAEDAKDVLSD